MSKCGCQDKFTLMEQKIDHLYKIVRHLMNVIQEETDNSLYEICEDGGRHIYGSKRDDHFNRVCVKCSRKETK